MPTDTASIHEDTAALAAYEGLAPFYDGLTAGYAHESWIDALEQLLVTHGLAGGRLLDVACGTGKSTKPWVAHGYETSACDISPAMVARARARLQLPADRVFVGDMRLLRPCADFDVVTCLDDSINYLLTRGDFAAAIRSMAGTLRPGGALLFDCNAFSLYQSRFVGTWETTHAGHQFSWHGQADAELAPGGKFSARLEVKTATGSREPAQSLASTVHRQRHHPPETVAAALAASGLRQRAQMGQQSGARLVRPANEALHPKLLYLAQKPQR